MSKDKIPAIGAKQEIIQTEADLLNETRRLSVEQVSDVFTQKKQLEAKASKSERVISTDSYGPSITTRYYDKSGQEIAIWQEGVTTGSTNTSYGVVHYQPTNHLIKCTSFGDYNGDGKVDSGIEFYKPNPLYNPTKK